jgi:arginine utilization protein RocB
MSDTHISRQVRSLAERLIALSSVSPDPAGEALCAEALAEALPGAMEHGLWPTADGRPVVWARLCGARPGGAGTPAVVVLGHYDTVGVGEFAALNDVTGDAVAFDPARLRALLIERAGHGSLPESVLCDVLEEVRRPGTWMFGRGALDMKAALAAGLAALGALAARPPAGDVWFIATPDEEHESAGMFAAVERLAMLAAEGARFLGVLNLDYGDAPALHCGVRGKMLGGVWVAGAPAHASDPAAGVDAAELAAAIALRITHDDALAAVLEAPPALLRLRDRKAHYDVQTAAEAEIHVNLMTGETPPRVVLDAFERAVALAAAHAQAGVLADAAKRGGAPGFEVRAHTWTGLPHVESAAHEAAHDPDVRERTLLRVRERALAAGIGTPAVVSFLLPPFYPASLEARGPLAAAARRACAAHGIPERGPYPHISDISYLRWSDEAGAAAATIPTFGGAYRLPVEAMRALDLDVINVGPWGHDAHGLYERVRADFVFDELPGVIERIVREALAG